MLFSFIILLIQIYLTAIVVPKSQNLARSIIRTSDFNFVDNFIKIKKFNASVNDLTIYTESKDKNNNYNNIYIKKDLGEKNFQIIYAEKGIFINNDNIPKLVLFDGENTSVIDEKITNFSFTKSEFNLSQFSTNTILVTKTQEHKTIELINCVMKLKKNNPNELKLIKEKVRNCEIKNLDNILSEIYKRLVIPLYLPTLMLLALLLIVNSKEKVNFSKLRLLVFLLGFFTIVFSESTLRFVGSSSNKNMIIMISPLITLLFLYFYFILKFNFKKSS